VRIVRACADYEVSLLLDADGGVHACGTGEALGPGGVTAVDVPMRVSALSGVHVVGAALTDKHALAVTSEGHAYSWGELDMKQRDLIVKKNEVEQLMYQTKQAVDKQEVQAKLSSEDKEVVSSAVQRLQEHIDNDYDNASMEDLNSWENEFNTSVQPVMTKLYQQQPSEPSAHFNTDNINTTDNGPTIEEID